MTGALQACLVRANKMRVGFEGTCEMTRPESVEC
jgi:hypothetical protein